MPCCVRVTVVSRKCMFECEYSCSNFIVGWEVFRWLRNVCRLSSPCVQTTKMLSMYRFQIRGWRLFGLLSSSLFSPHRHTTIKRQRRLNQQTGTTTKTKSTGTKKPIKHTHTKLSHPDKTQISPEINTRTKN